MRGPWLRRLAAWAVTLGLLGFLAWKVPFAEVARQLPDARGGWLALAGLSLVAIYLCDALATWSTFSRLGGPVPLGGMLVARGASYLLASLTYVAGQGALLYFVRRANGLTTAKAGAIILVIAAANLMLLMALAGLGLALSVETPPLLPLLLAVGLAGTVVYAVLLVVRPKALARLGVVSGLFDAGLAGQAWATLVRLPHVLALMAYSFAMLRAFSVEVPVVEALFRLPVIYVIAFLPISVQGLGTSQAAMLPLFSPFAAGPQTVREAAVLASSLSAFALMTAFQSVLGLICLRTPLGKLLKAQGAAA